MLLGFPQLLPNLPNWPGLNTAFLLSLFGSIALTLLVIPYAKRRPIGTPLSWGEAMVASAYAFFVMFLAYGVAPHQWLTHADNELGWRSDKLLYGPGDVVSTVVPFTITYEVIRDIIATVIYVVMLGLQIWVWSYWQKRGQKKVQPELAASTFGRPLVRRG